MSKQSWYGGDTPSPFVRKNEFKRSWYTGSSMSLVVTFLLGVGVGFFIRYAWFELREEPQEATVAVVDTVPAETAGDAASETDMKDLEVAPQPAELEDVWPARHLIVGIPGTALDPDSAEMLNRYKPGGVWLRASNTANEAQLRGLVAQVAPLAALEPGPAALPLVVAAQDGGEDGNILQLPQAPSYETIARLDTLEAIRESGKSTAARALELGVGMLLSPVLDVYDEAVRDAAERSRFLGTTPESVARAGIAYIEGLQEGGALAVAKHYPGIGSATIQKGTLPLIKEENVDTLSATMQVFADAAANDVAGILISGATIPVLDTEMPGRPTCLSPAMVREVLRRRCGFDGVLIAEDMRAIAPWSENTMAQNVVAALAAGCDAVLVSSVSVEEMAAIRDAIKQAVENDLLNEEELLLSRQRLDLCRVKLARVMSPERPETAPESVALEGEAAEGEAKADSSPAEGAPEPEPGAGAEPAEAAETQAPEPEEAVEAPEETPSEPEAEEAPAPEADAEPAATQKAAPPEGARKVVHTIKQGDTLTRIATTYGVSIKDIMQWNALEDTNIKFGRKLDIYTTAEAPQSDDREVEDAESRESEAAPEESTPSEPSASEITDIPATSEAAAPDPEEAPEAPEPVELAPEETAPAAPEAVESATELSEPAAADPVEPVAAAEEAVPEPDAEPPAPTEAPAVPEESSRDVEEESIEVDHTFPPADVFPEVNPNAEGPPEILPFDTPPPEIPSEDTEEKPAGTIPPILPGGEAAEKELDTGLAPAEPEMTVTEIPASPSPVLEPNDLQNLPDPPETLMPPVETDRVDTAAEPAMAVGENDAEAPAPAESTDAGHRIHVVGAGDTLNKIADKYGVTVPQLLAVNTFDNPDILFVGHEVKVPNP